MKKMYKIYWGITGLGLVLGAVALLAPQTAANTSPVTLKNDPVSVVAPETAQVSPYGLDATTSVIFEQTNEARVSDGEAPLTINAQLMKSAWYRALYFCSNPLAHNSPSGTTPWDFFVLSGYNFKDAGENLAEGYASPEQMQAAFMASPDHRDNILKPGYQDIGLQEKCGHVVVLFGSQQTI